MIVPPKKKTTTRRSIPVAARARPFFHAVQYISSVSFARSLARALVPLEQRQRQPRRALVGARGRTPVNREGEVEKYSCKKEGPKVALCEPTSPAQKRLTHRGDSHLLPILPSFTCFYVHLLLAPRSAQPLTPTNINHGFLRYQDGRGRPQPLPLPAPVRQGPGRVRLDWRDRPGPPVQDPHPGQGALEGACVRFARRCVLPEPAAVPRTCATKAPARRRRARAPSRAPRAAPRLGPGAQHVVGAAPGLARPCPRSMCDKLGCAWPHSCPDASKTPPAATWQMPEKASDLPEWNYDGSSTQQAPGQNSEVILKPQVCVCCHSACRSSPKATLCVCARESARRVFLSPRNVAPEAAPPWTRVADAPILPCHQPGLLPRPLPRRGTSLRNARTVPSTLFVFYIIGGAPRHADTQSAWRR